MSNQYPGGLITKTPVVPNSISAPGIWTLSQQAAAQATNTWPFPRDPQFNYVTMLLHGDGSAQSLPTTGVGAGASSTVTNFNADASTNNFNVTINGDARSDNFTPYQAGYYSNYFASGAYIRAGTSANLALGSGAWTCESWVFPTSFTTTAGPLWDFRNVGGYVTTAPLITFNTTGTVQYQSTLTSTTAVSLNTWSHIAIVRSGTTVTIYINGVASGTVTDSTTMTNTYCCIGAVNDAPASYYLTAYVSNARLVVGTAVYTAAFTPTTSPLTAISGTQFLSCQSNRFVDNSTNNFTFSFYGSPQVSPAQPFTLPTTVATYGSGYFGSANYLSAASNAAFGFGTGDFTVEAWVYPNAAYTTYNYIWATGANGGLVVYVLGGVLYVRSYNVADLLASSVAPVLNAWSHVAVTRSGTTLRIFVNGVQTGTTTNSTNFATGSGLIGNDGSNAAPWYGSMTDVRVVKGTAVYTSAYTPPTTPLTAITNTSLLTTQYNGGGNNSGFKDSSQFNFPITRNGNTTQGTFTPYGSNWSNYFNGTTDYLQIAYNAALDAGTGAFTYEAWLNPSTTTSKQYLGGSVTNAFFAFIGSGTIFVGRNNVAVDFTSSATINTNQWNHVVIVRNSSNNIAIFINGASAYYNASNTNNYGLASNPLRIGVATTGSSYEYNGYISNVRISKSALYDPTASTITVPTTPLTAVSGTALLTCQSNRFVDNSTNAFAITTSGSPSVQRFSPFAPLTVYNPTTYGGSGYFNGSTSYLTAASNPSFAFGTGDFTIELWYYFSATTGSNQHLVDMRGASSSATAPLLYVSTSNVIIFYTNGANQIANTTLSVGSWYHIALTRSGATTRLFVNGVLSGSVGDTNSYIQSSVFLGRASDAAGGYVNGFECDARILKGTAVYTAAFTPPTASLTAITGTSLLVSTTNPAILDNSMLNNLETVGNAAVSTSVKKYGSASMYFDGTGDYLTVPASPNFIFGTGDFTVEMWVQEITSWNPAGGANYAHWISLNSYTTGIMIRPNTTGTAVEVWVGNTQYTFTTTLSLGVWYHIAVSRSSSSMRFFVNGTQIGSTQTVTYNISTNTANTIGTAVHSTGEVMQGYIDDLRITKYGRYTANFTAPTQAFPNG